VTDLSTGPAPAAVDPSDPLRTDPPREDLLAVGGPDGLSRRQFLALAGGVGAVGALGVALGPRAWDAAFAGGRPARGTLAPAGRSLVLVTLYGGNDGLNTVVPSGDPHYVAARGGLAVDPTSLLPMADGYSLHPSLPGFKKLWDAGHLAVVHGVGFANPNYSHFESMDIWQSGARGAPDGTGWLGRWLDRTNASPLRAIGIGPSVPMALTGAKIQGATLPGGTIQFPGTRHEQSLFAQLAGTSRTQALLAAAAARADADLIEVRRRIGGILDHTATVDPLHLRRSGTDGAAALAIAAGGGGRSAPGVLATQLSLVANLVLAGAPTEVYSVELGGFDTHSNQAPSQAALLGELDTAVTAFVDALAHDPKGRETVVVVYTEFGRRVTGNASGGSDHGWANVVFVAGAPVNGGWYGEPPSLTTLSDGNLVFTTDFRSVYATVLGNVLGVDPKPFLGGRFPSLGFL
jgi:uncharacterized protein (DUF1501 family)